MYGYGYGYSFGADAPIASASPGPVAPGTPVPHTDITAPVIPGIQATPAPTVPGVHTGLQRGVSGMACIPIYFFPFPHT